MPPSWKTGKVPENIVSCYWVGLIWRHSSSSKLSMIEDLSLIPVQEDNETYYRHLQRNPRVMLTTYQGKSKVTDPIKALLVDNDVEFASEGKVSIMALNNQQFLQEYILLPDETGILNGLRNRSYHSFQLSDNFCADFKKMIENANVNLPSFVFQMKLFRDLHEKKVSAKESYIVIENDIPPGFAESNCDISLVLSSSVSQRLQERLSYEAMQFDNLITQYLSCYSVLSVDDSKFFVKKISRNGNVSDRILSRLKSKVRVKTEGGTEDYAYSLFEKTKETKELFYHEKYVFPDESYDMEGLRKLGLKSEAHITAPDIIARINYVSRHYAVDYREDFAKKINVIMKFCKTLKISLPPSIKWIPIEKILPPKYPTSLVWKAQLVNCAIESFQNVYQWHHFELVGSTSFIASRSVSERLSEFECYSPSLNDILYHLQNVERSYNDDEKGLYKRMLMNIYKYLGEMFHAEEVSREWKKLDLKLWQDDCFIEPRRITVLQDCLNLSPYMYSPKEDIPKSFKTVLKYICDENESKLGVYIHVLSEMLQHYDKENGYSTKDLSLAVEMLRVIADHYDQLQEEQKNSICIPIEGTYLKFSNVRDCFYHDHADQLTGSEVRNHKITHRDVDDKIISVLHIPDLVSEILNDDQDDLFEDWGQTEPLTLRLNRLLKDYEDGLPIFKELIQNADDAKATKVSFLYDERTNDHLKSSLIDQSMKPWQGPALWVYNNAVFTEEDFENIRQINAGTKESDTTKIGKFGLGFNSVYHLTDVPCFLSGNFIVYFDPHSKYLGRALRSKKDCGKRINLEKNKSLIAFNDQFKVFDGIFQAKVDFAAHSFETYKSTLFRLPLRNEETKSKSAISSLNYSSYEMISLLDKLKESLGTLILFTENVKNVSVYHLGKNDYPCQMTPLFNVKKETNTFSSSLIHDNLLLSTTKQLKNADVQDLVTDKLTSARIMSIDMIQGFDENIKNVVSKETWLQLAFTGSQKSLEFAKVHKGLVPCGGVAINYRKSDQKFEVIRNNNKIFCFLPLPKRSDLPVSINGAFLITNDRKQLVVKSDEVKYKTEDWNLILAEDIGRAYFDLLLHLKNTVSQWQINDWFSLYPGNDDINHDAFNNTILSALVKNLVHSNEDIFPVADEKGYINRWVKWGSIRCPPKRSSEMNLDILSFMSWYYQRQKLALVCLNFPKKIYNLIKFYTSKETLDELCILEDEFFDLFFSSLSHIPKKLADNIMLKFLSLHPKDESYLRKHMENTPCIPTLPTGTLQRPSNLVKSNSIVAQLYDVQDEVFPCEEYVSKHDSFLQTLGMNVKSLHWNKMISKAKEIAVNQRGRDINLRIDRSKLLLKLMGKSLNQCSVQEKSEVIEIPFLPVRFPPESSNEINWYGKEKHFCTAKEGYIPQYVNIVSSVAPILDFKINDKFAKFLGVDRVPTFQQANAQIKQIEAKYKVLIDKKETPEICEILLDLFRFLFQNYPWECCQFTSRNIIYDNDRKYLATPRQIFFDFRDELIKVPGYMYKVSSDLTLNKEIRPFLKAVGVQESPDIAYYVNVLKNVKDDYQSQHVPEPLLNVIVNRIIPKIARNSYNLKIDSEIYLPDDDRIMQKTTDVCFKDVDWIMKPEDVIFVHCEIPWVYCKSLGIKTFRAQYLQNSGIGIGFGQHEDLTNRIKNLLRGYTEKDVIKELLQNADDSGATEIEFILDCRNHSTKRVLSNEWKKLQGPALIVTNNGVFTENDLNAIQRLGEGNKSRDRLKTGRYGVGFNVVYNITDCPSMHVIIENKAHLCVFDPNLQYNIGGTIEKPGQMFSSSVIKSSFRDVYDAHIFDENNVPNTLFRLPLRTKEMAEKSEISPKETRVEAIEDYLGEIYQYVSEMLLFLVNIKKAKFSIFKIENNKFRKSCEEFVVFSYDFTQSDFDRKLQLTNEYAQNPSIKSVANVNYKTCIRHISDGFDCCRKHYQVNEQVGFSEINSSEVASIEKFKEFFTFPKGAVAFYLKEVECYHCGSTRKKNTCRRQRSQDGQNTAQNVFCTLPISTNSGLTALVNGNFILEYETRRTFWVGINCPERDWNNNILSHCVLPCYIFLLKQFRDKILKTIQKGNNKDIEKFRQEVYKYFPKEIGEREENYWHYFNFLYYQEIFSINEELLPVVCNETNMVFARPEDQFIVYINENENSETSQICPISTKNRQKPQLLDILQNAGLHIDVIPSKIADNFKDTGNPLIHISPELIRERLKKISDNIVRHKPLAINQSCFKNASSLAIVLEYCMKDLNDYLEVEKELVGLPLCLLADNTLIVFSESYPVFVSRFYNIFESKQSMFIHRELVRRLTNHVSQYTNMIKNFQLGNFMKMLPDELNENKYKGSIAMKFDAQNQIEKKWLRTVWNFLKDFKKDLREIVGDWLLLFARFNTVEYLLPVTDSTSVLFLDAAGIEYKDIIEVLRALPIYEVRARDFVNDAQIYYREQHSKEIEIYPHKFKSNFFGSIGEIKNFENALWLSYLNYQWKLNEYEAETILRHLEELLLCQKHYYFSIIQKLPVFIRYNGCLTKIDRETVVLPQSDIPVDGLDIVEKNMHIIFVKGEYQNLYEKIGFTKVSKFQFYLSYIFPHLHLLSVTTILKQMNYVKMMLSGLCSWDFGSDDIKFFFDRLSNLRFIPTREGVLKAPQDFYDPDVELFKLVLEEGYFPPSEFCRETWLPFLRKIGLITNLTVNIAIKMAGLIQHLEDARAAKASKILVKTIKQEEFTDNEYFLGQLKSVKFLIPKKIEEINETIYKSLNKYVSRVCYYDAVHHSQENLVWTSKLILPSYACCFDYKTYTRLGVRQGARQILFKDVLKHVDNITNNNNYQSRSRTCKVVPAAYRKQYIRILGEIYEFLMLLRPLKHSQIELLMNRSLILVTENTALDIPGRSNLGSQMLLAPYINQVVVFFGQFFELFKEMGCRLYPNIEQLFDVIREIKENTDGRNLDPNELKAVIEAVSNVSILIKTDPWKNDDNAKIYLPCIKTFHPESSELVYLQDSSKVIFIDDYHLQKRLVDFKGNFMLSTYIGVEDSGNINKKIVEGLPKINAPKLLSELVQEVLKEPVSEIEAPPNHYSRTLKKTLSSEYFYAGLERLLKHEYKAMRKDLPKLQPVFTILKSAKISVLQKVETSLFFSGQVISASEIEKDVYTRVTSNSFEIYLQISEQREASTKIVQGILSLLEIYSVTFFENKNVLVLPKMLEFQPIEIAEVLDTFGIARDASEATPSYFPSPGDLVPQSLYPYLSNNFERFNIGDFVAVNKEFEDEECYIYGIVRGCESIEDADFLQLIYDVQADEDPDKITKLRAFELHGFDRINQINASKEIVKTDIQHEEHQDDVSQSYEDAVREIRNALMLLEGLDRDSKRKVIRRLYLKWHPDKHEGSNVQLATRVFQFLINELKSDRYSFEDEYSRWTSSARAHANYRKKSSDGFSYYRSFRSRSSSFDFWSFSECKTNNPQPAESKRWYRQAERDLQAAIELRKININCFFQWHCFMAKQVFWICFI